MSNELKPCPFCGGEAEITKYKTRYGVEWVVYHNCDFVEARLYPTEAEAIKAWNTRAERTCHRFWTGAEMICSNCAHQLNDATANYCPNCGRKVVKQ